MKISLNTMVKNEADTLQNVLPIWNKYKVDYFIFYNDNSTDETVDVIYDLLPEEKIIILNHNLESFNEGYQRQTMIDKSRELGIDYIICLDADELLSSNITKDITTFMKNYEEYDMKLFWYNVVNDGLILYRNDPMYSNNYRTFILPIKNIGDLNKNDWKYHTPRTPEVNLPKKFTKEYGIIHLQSVNTKFYAMKQLWYKHHEFVNYGHSIEYINNRYDPVVNNLNFNELETPKDIIEGINFDVKVFKSLIKKKMYLDFIKKNYNKQLITFGEEYVQ